MQLHKLSYTSPIEFSYNSKAGLVYSDFVFLHLPAQILRKHQHVQVHHHVIRLFLSRGTLILNLAVAQLFAKNLPKYDIHFKDYR